MPSARSPRLAIDRDRAIKAIQDAERIVALLPKVTADDSELCERLMLEGRRMMQMNQALVLALLWDEYTPAKLFKYWASVRRIRDWRDDPAIKLDVIVRHGRVCVKPSEFFKHWKTLPATARGESRQLLGA